MITLNICVFIIRINITFIIIYTDQKFCKNFVKILQFFQISTCFLKIWINIYLHFFIFMLFYHSDMITKSFHKKNPTSRLNNSDFFSQWSGWRGSNPQQSAWKAGTLANWVTPAHPLCWNYDNVFLSLFKRKFFIWAWLGSNQRPIGYEPTALTTELHTHLQLRGT